MEIPVTDASIHWHRLRLKPDPTADDFDWQGQNTSPNRLTAVVGGTADDGDYELYIVGTLLMPDGRQIGIDATISATRAAAETSAQMATALDTAFESATARTDLLRLLTDLGFSCSVSSETLAIVFPAGFSGTLSSSAPGTATITHPVGAAVPICASSPLYARAGASSPNAVVVMWVMRDDAGDTPLLPGNATITMTAVELAVVERDGVYEEVVCATAAVAATTANTPYELPLRGAKYWTVRLTTDSNLTANTDSIEVLWRDAAT